MRHKNSINGLRLIVQVVRNVPKPTRDTMMFCKNAINCIMISLLISLCIPKRCEGACDDNQNTSQRNMKNFF